MTADDDITDMRLSKFVIKGLFGEFDHEIPLSPSSRITALIAPNGMGKTACLRLINALFRRKWSIFASTEFEKIVYEFSDGSTIEARRSDQAEVFDESSQGVTFYIRFNDELETWSPRPVELNTQRLLRPDRYLPYISQTGPNRWVHDATRQVYNFQELIENFSDQLPDSVLSGINYGLSPNFSALIDKIDCHLIETQRLLILGDDDPRRPASSKLTISKKAQTLKEIIAQELTNYAALSQSLDRSFPKRVIEMGPIHPSEDLKGSLGELDVLRRKLMDAGILDTEHDDTLLPPGQVDSAIAAVLSVYVRDTKRKLESLSTILSRLTLFIELIDNRFKPKVISVDKRTGFSVKRGLDVTVPLEKLSSGEQHQLVLFFELLFELKPNALILIDEPELSLHVAWQKKFISDLQRIILLNGFDVLLATHSPQLIGRWTDLVVELGDVDAE